MQKTNFKTRLLALLTAVFMVVMCMPFAALADAPDVVVDLDWDKDQVEVTDWGSFRDVDGYVSATVKPGGEVVMPTVKGINGYKFKGWTNVGNKTKLTLADVTPYLGVGKSTLQLKAIAEKAPVVADTIVTVDVLVDTNTMKITNYGDFKKDDNDDGYATANFDKPGKELTLPTVEGINGYTFTGWDKVGTATSLTTEEALKLCADGKTTVVLNAQAGFTVSFIDRDTKESVGGTYTVKFDATGNRINVSSTDGGKTLVIEDGTHEAQTIFAPDGYQLNVMGDYTVEDGKVILPVEKISEPEAGFTINFVDDEGNVASDLTFTFKFNPTDNKVGITTTDDGKTATFTDDTYGVQTIYAPDGYKIVTRGDLPVKNGVVSLKIAKIETKPTTKFYVMFKDGETISGLKYGFKYDPEDGKVNISSKDNGVNLTIDEGTSHQQTFKAPEGYRVHQLGGYDVKDGKVILDIEKIPTQKSVALNYILDGKTVGTTTLMVNADATKIEIRNNDGVVTANGQQIIAPEGYVFCNFGDFPIQAGKDVNYVNLTIAAGTKEITLSFYVEGAEDKPVKKIAHTVATNATKVEVRENNGKFTVDSAELKAPDGYKLVVRGDFPIENDNVNLKVVKIETANSSSSSSSSASSSSNTTTTAASQQQVVEASSNTTTTAASQKQVVKAAAAPANTTKVLPKTGATNAAPLIGGSLAVVALLMGYGVYGLVLRKKD